MTEWSYTTPVPQHTLKDSVADVELMLLGKLQAAVIIDDEDEVNEIHLALKQIRTLP